jgi:hypothetical protein
MNLQISAITASFATAALLAWPTAASALKDLVIDVNCASGDRIERALDRINVLDRRMIIVVNGTCSENVVIERDDVTLKAGTSGGGVSAADRTKPAILINGARRVSLENLAVSGGLNTVQVTGGASATVRGTTVRYAETNGVLVDSGASATLDGCTVENNGQQGIVADGARAKVLSSNVRGNGMSGVLALRAGSVVLGTIDVAGAVCCGNTIENNTLDGVLAVDASAVNMFGNIIRGNGTTSGRFGVLAVQSSAAWLRGGNVVSNNGSATAGGGLFARTSVLRTGPGDTPTIPSTNEISGNTAGLLAQSNSGVDLRGGVTITGNRFSGVSVDTGSRLRTDGSTFSGNGASGILAQRASSVELFGTGNIASSNGQWGLSCGDGESSFSGNTSGFTGNTLGPVNPTCSGF